MARTALSVQQIDRDTNGLAATRAAVAVTDLSIPNNDGRIFLEVVNTGSGNVVVTVQTPGSVAGLAVAELVCTCIGTTGDIMIGPLPPAVFNRSDGSVNVDLSITTTMTIGCFRL